MQPESPLSRAAVDQLGDRLRVQVTETDLRLLDQHRRTFRPDYTHVVAVLRSEVGIEVSGRPAKSTAAIVDKLNRSSMRLSQMQDIAGCRTVVADVAEQDRLISVIEEKFPCVVSDRRLHPSHGYRAVHVVVRSGRLPIEVQVRTRLQHLWAEISEKFADELGIEVKYGGGQPTVRKALDATSALVAQIERLEGKREVADEVVKLRQAVQNVLNASLTSVRSTK
jgi:ppGpp synthetase/RelA/SpoT-type nucleotidyltranferase